MGLLSPPIVSRAAADATALAVISTPAVSCAGNLLVSFHVVATDTDTLSAAVIEISEDGTNWIAAGTVNGVTAVTSTIAPTIALNGAGLKAWLQAGSANYQVIQWMWCRLTVTVGASDISGLAITTRLFGRM